MRLFEQRDDKGMKRKSKTGKFMRQRKHRVERRKEKQDPECQATYNKYKGYVL